uniref:Uncharacterized protein n=2 Tax=Rhodnius prolixus TaxID=13249 RepID=T1I339_RHOPR
MYARGVLILVIFSLVAAELEVMYQWPVVKWDMPFKYRLATPYTGERTVVNSAEVGWDRVFLTLPRIWTGNPATLAVVPRPKNGYPVDQSPPLQAYPSWEWHAEAASGRIANSSNCSGFVSVFRVRIDRCNRLWVMDSGVLDSLVTFSVVCPPRMFIFDLNTDKLIRTITLPKDVTRPNTLIANFIFDEQVADFSTSAHASCDNMIVYMADTTNPSIIIYDVARDSAWRIQHPKMFPDPDYGTYTVAGEYYTLMDGILGLTLGASNNLQKMLYFQPFASARLFGIATADLLRGQNLDDAAELPVVLTGHKSSQSAALCTDLRDGSLVFSPVTETAVASWVPGSADHKVLAYSPESLQIVTDIRPAATDGANLWLVSTRLQKFFRRTISPQEFNLRVMRLVPDLPLLNNTFFYYK